MDTNALKPVYPLQLRVSLPLNQGISGPVRNGAKVHQPNGIRQVELYREDVTLADRPLQLFV